LPRNASRHGDGSAPSLRNRDKPEISETSPAF
jgi:hypothetical protein